MAKKKENEKLVLTYYDNSLEFIRLEDGEIIVVMENKDYLLKAVLTEPQRLGLLKFLEGSK